MLGISHKHHNLANTVLIWVVMADDCMAVGHRFLFRCSSVHEIRHNRKHNIRDPRGEKRMQVALGSEYGGEAIGHDKESSGNDADGKVHTAAATGFTAGDDHTDDRQEQYSRWCGSSAIAFYFKCAEPFGTALLFLADKVDEFGCGQFIFQIIILAELMRFKADIDDERIVLFGSLSQAVYSSFHGILQPPFILLCIPLDEAGTEIINKLIVFYPVKEKPLCRFAGSIVVLNADVGVMINTAVKAIVTVAVLLVFGWITTIDVIGLEFTHDRIGTRDQVAVAKPEDRGEEKTTDQVRPQHAVVAGAAGQDGDDL